jgi:2-methylcitrate dehydratase PrpD
LLADFIAGFELKNAPPDVVDRARVAFIDTMGVMLAGSREEVAHLALDMVKLEGATQAASIVGQSLRTSPQLAALANGVAAHAMDYDFTFLSGQSVSPVIPALLPLAESTGASPADCVAAFIVGAEVAARLLRASPRLSNDGGWHSTGTVGSIAAAAACAKLMKLPAEKIPDVLGISVSLASGVAVNYGTMTKPLHSGNAARNGILAAQLAREGMTASETALEGRQGYAAAFGGARPLDQALESLGRCWHLLGSGIAVKPYPSCALTHSAIDALIDLRAEHRLSSRNVAAVEVGVNRVVPDVLAHPRPTTALERKFSMQFCAAAALAEGRVDFGSFTDGEITNAETRELMERVAMVVDPGLPEGVEQHAWSRVTVRLRDGRTVSTEARGARGHPDTPLSDAALREKFLGCSRTVLGADEAEGVAEQIEHLEDIPDIRALTSRLEGNLV